MASDPFTAVNWHIKGTNCLQKDVGADMFTAT